MPGFYVAFADSTGARDTGTEVDLSPRPTRVIYPEEPRGTPITTPDGSVVVQYQNRDSRTRTWVWEGYPSDYAPYVTLWSQIEPLASVYRWLSGAATPYCYLKEDMTGLLRTTSAVGNTVTSTYPWLRCRVIRVARPTLTEGTSLVRYASTQLVFVVEDPTYQDYA